MSRAEDLAVWKMFAEVVRSGGVNAACDVLGCEPSTVSRAVKAIESEIGAPVFRREGRALKLNSLGMRAHEKAQALIAQYDAMIEDLRGDKERFSGSIRMASIAGITAVEITPCLIEFLKVYPDIELELIDLAEPIPQVFMTKSGVPVDLAIGYGPNHPIEGVVARYLGDMPFICCASPLYIRQHGFPEHPADLKKHTGLLFEPAMRPMTRSLEYNGVEAALCWNHSMTFKNLLSVRSAAVLGAGIVPDLPLYHAMDALRAGQLVPVMEGWRRSPASCFVFASEEAYEKRRIRALVDCLVDNERRLFDRLRAEFPLFFK